jgi:AcrR family transcriptional regulator
MDAVARRKAFDRDLVTRMRIQRGSLYGTFGDKPALFLAAMDRYERDHGGRTPWERIEESSGRP